MPGGLGVRPAALAAAQGRQRANPQPPSSRRGRTRPDRLRLIDTWLVRELSTRSPRAGAGPLQVVDVGFGDSPATTRALHRRLTEAGMTACCVGVEREPARVQAAQHHATDGLRFVHGGFALGELDLGPIHVARAFNVLRAYGLDQVREALGTLGAALAEGGLLVEGSSDTEGHVASAHLWRRDGHGMAYQGLLLCCDGARGFSPWLLRDHLPRDLRRHVRAPEPVHALLDAWATCWERVRVRCPRESFVRSLRALSDARDDVRFDPWLAAHGIARWQPERPSHRPEVFDGRLD